MSAIPVFLSSCAQFSWPRWAHSTPTSISFANLFHWFPSESLKIWQRPHRTMCVPGNDLVGDYFFFLLNESAHCVRMCVSNWVRGPTTESDTRRWDSFCSWQELSDYRGAHSARLPNLIRQGEKKGFQCKVVPDHCEIVYDSITIYWSFSFPPFPFHIKCRETGSERDL